MSGLAEMKCTACRSGEPALTDAEMEKTRNQTPGACVPIRRFRRALDFTNRVGETVEEEGHHPVLLTEWGGVTVAWWTHKFGGLHRNGLAMAAKPDELFKGRL